nr:restriction endonuclease subunit S [Lactobacillus helveticus]
MDLAMRGKLVPQDPNDEPASVLLEKIKAEKAELIKEKKIKKTKPLPPITDDEKLFDIPDSWEWVRLGDVGEIFAGGDKPKDYSIIKDEEHQIPIYSNGIKNKGLYGFTEVARVFRPAVTLSARGTIGHVEYRSEPFLPIIRLISFVPYDDSYLKCIFYFLQSKQLIEKGDGSSIPQLTVPKLKPKILPLPPLSEQSRIAAKIAQLFALLRKVETSTQQYAKLQTLLKSKVLDLAMRGKLVKQDPNDEPASVLLEKIKAEKQELIKEKKIKKTKSLPPITDGEKPFDIPDSWEWVRLGEICEIKGGKRVPKGRKLEDQVSYKPYIRVADMQDQSVNTDTLKYASKDIFNEISRYTISSKDVYFSIAGTIGKVGSIPKKLDGALLTENAAKLEFFAAQEMNKKFFIEMLSSDFIKEQHKEMLSKVAQPKLALIKLRKTIIPLPPVSEQKRVVGKILQIFSQ